MRMTDPKPTFSYLVGEIAKRHPNFAYVHLVEPRVDGIDERTPAEGEVCLSTAFVTDSMLIVC